MHTGIDLLAHSRDLLIHWLKRTGAFLVDLAIVAAPISLALASEGALNNIYTAGLASGAGLFLYSAVLEGVFGRTWGKRLFGLRVVAIEDKNGVLQALVRSIPKFFWYIFLPVDTLAGLATEGDPRQRWSDRVLSTTVVSIRNLRTDKRPRSMRKAAPESGAK